MSDIHKALVISDIHIDEYRYYNPTDEDYDYQALVGRKDNYRLYQCLTLAESLVSYGKLEGITDLYLLGDIINRPSPSPIVIKTTMEFLEILNDYFNVYYILGNHDANASSNECAFDNSVIPILAKYLDKFKYSNDSIIYKVDRNGSEVSFLLKDYQYNTSTIDYSECDVALGHVTLSFGQSTTGNYKIGIFGDIHEPIDIGRDHSVGTPYQLFPSQPEIGCIGLIDYSDKDDIKFHRLNSDEVLSKVTEV